MKTLQHRVGTWHQERFPHAQMAHVALKGSEEMGEVASAVIGIAGVQSATGDGDVVSEAADVVICMMVLLDRWFSHADLIEEVEKKLAILNDRNSIHRASLS